jgi:hypothetical protein
MQNIFHIRAVDSARHFGDGAPKALVPVANIPRPHEVCVPFVIALDTSERALRPSILLMIPVVPEEGENASFSYGRALLHSGRLIEELAREKWINRVKEVCGDNVEIKLEGRYTLWTCRITGEGVNLEFQAPEGL